MEESAKMLNVADSTEEVAEETTEVIETSQETDSEDFEFTDSEEPKEESKDDSKEEQKDESKEPSKEDSKDNSKESKQSDEENANFAKIRRKAEEDAQKKIEAEKQKAYEQGKLDSYKGKINPYTDKPITDLADVEVYETMYQLEKEGKDPINDLPEALATKRRDEAKVIQEKKELESKTRQELEEFQNKYPNVNLQELLDDSFFQDYIQGKNRTITELYEGFNNFKNAYRNSAVDAAKQTLANAQASPGSLSSEADVTVDYNTMSSEEFNKQLQAVKDGELK